jgi:hypothetical protein
MRLSGTEKWHKAVQNILLRETPNFCGVQAEYGISTI